MSASSFRIALRLPSIASCSPRCRPTGVWLSCSSFASPTSNRWIRRSSSGVLIAIIFRNIRAIRPHATFPECGWQQTRINHQEHEGDERGGGGPRARGRTAETQGTRRALDGVYRVEEIFGTASLPPLCDLCALSWLLSGSRAWTQNVRQSRTTSFEFRSLTRDRRSSGETPNPFAQ